jgi:putative CocE/NonD family hydrolase
MTVHVRRGRSAAALVMPLVLFAGVAACAGSTRASAATPAWTPDEPTWNGKYVQTDVPITMRDGVVLRANVGIPVPMGAQAPQPGLRFPVLISQTPYRKDGGLFTVDPYFVSRGFAMVVVDVRGTGSSQGLWQSFYGPEQEDGPEVVRWATHQPWANGRAGLMGASYLAINQLLTMEQPDAPSEVKAIFPVVPMSDGYRDVTYHGGNLDSAFIPPWLGLVTSLGAPPGHHTFNGNPQDFADGLSVGVNHVYNATQFQVPVTVDATTGGAKTYDSAYYQSISPIRRLDRVHVPTFVVGGEFDIFQRGEPLLYSKLNVPAKRLIMGPWVHLQGSQASSLPADGIPDLKTLQLQWFDEYVKGVPTGEDAQPRVLQYELKGTKPSHFVASEAYPIGSLQPRNLYLQPGTSGSAHSLNDGVLGDAPPKLAGSDPLPYVPTGTPCSRTTFQWGDASATPYATLPCEADERPNEVQLLTYTTPALTAPLTVNGPINVHLVAQSTNGQNMPLTVRVTDVAPDGTSTQLSAGWLLASMRATAESPVTERVDGTLLRVFHPFTQASELPVATTPTPYDIEVFPTFATFDAGHRIRLDVGTGDSPHMTLSAPHQAQSTGAVFLVDRNPDNPSYLSLPVMAAADQHVGGAAQSAPPDASVGGPRVSAALAALPNTAGAGAAGWPVAGLLAGAGVAMAAGRRRSRRGTMPGDTGLAHRRGGVRS